MNQNVLKGLGLKNITDYLLEHSNLKEDQFVFAQPGGDGYTTLFVSKENKLISLGSMFYGRFIRLEYRDCNDRVVLAKFLDLCIEKLNDLTIEVPMLLGNHEMWDECYKGLSL